jgi:uncharacterized protein YjbI with pentapeptide repeats
MGSDLKLRNHPVLWAAVGVVVTIVLAAGVVLALQRTGDANAVSDNAPLIAAVIALGGVFTAQMVSIALEQQRTRETNELEDRRTQEARDLEAQRAGETALQNYLGEVGTLLIEQPLRRAKPGDNLSTVVRAQTLSVLEGLDPDRKRILLLFLHESGLIYARKLVVSLVAANLSDANLSDANLIVADLSKADLSDAKLIGADLSNVKLNEANLSDADLKGASLSEANLRKSFANHVNLGGAILSGTKLTLADLSGANLSGANLSGASLRNANLSEARGWTEEQLAAAGSLEDATMPDGQTLRGDRTPNGPTFEDWLKSKGHRTNGELE